MYNWTHAVQLHVVQGSTVLTSTITYFQISLCSDTWGSDFRGCQAIMSLAPPRHFCIGIYLEKSCTLTLGRALGQVRCRKGNQRTGQR